MNKEDKLKAQLVIVTGLLVLSWFFKLQELVYVAMGIGVVSLAVPVIGDLIVKGWFKLAEVLGWVNSRILLSVIFYVFLFPVSLLSRLFKKDILHLNGKNTGSVFETRNHKYTKEDMMNIW